MPRRNVHIRDEDTLIWDTLSKEKLIPEFLHRALNSEATQRLIERTKLDREDWLQSDEDMPETEL